MFPFQQIQPVQLNQAERGPQRQHFFKSCGRMEELVPGWRGTRSSTIKFAPHHMASAKFCFWIANSITQSYSTFYCSIWRSCKLCATVMALGFAQRQHNDLGKNNREDNRCRLLLYCMTWIQFSYFAAILWPATIAAGD